MSAPPRPLVILGPTASGKSEVAMAMAAAMAPAGAGAGHGAGHEAGHAAGHGAGHAAGDGAPAIGQVEIVAVDSMQVYRGMDIGTAKPSAADRAAVIHHGLDLVDPDTEFGVADFAAQVGPVVGEIAARAATPLLVAGTGLYLRALTDPMEIPARSPEVRAELERRCAEEGARSLHRELERIDPVAAARIDPNNARRTVRALEVCIGSGRRFSEHGPGLDRYPPIAHLMVGIRWARPALAARIERRVGQMMAAGLLAEVDALRTRFPELSRTAGQALGYRELIAHRRGETSLDEAISMIVRRTTQFAVRQERWFRRDPRITWVDVTDDPVSEVVPVLRSLIQR